MAIKIDVCRKKNYRYRPCSVAGKYVGRLAKKTKYCKIKLPGWSIMEFNYYFGPYTLTHRNKQKNIGNLKFDMIWWDWGQSFCMFFVELNWIRLNQFFFYFFLFKYFCQNRQINWKIITKSYASRIQIHIYITIRERDTAVKCETLKNRIFSNNFHFFFIS